MYHTIIKKISQWPKPHFSIHLSRGQRAVSSIIIDSFFLKKFLEYVDGVLSGEGKDEYRTEGYVATVAKEKGEKVLEIRYTLSDEGESSFIDASELKKILTFWIQQKEMFDKDPDDYMSKLIMHGAYVCTVEEWDKRAKELADSEVLDRDVIIVETKVEKEEWLSKRK